MVEVPIHPQVSKALEPESSLAGILAFSGIINIHRAQFCSSGEGRDMASHLFCAEGRECSHSLLSPLKLLKPFQTWDACLMVSLSQYLLTPFAGFSLACSRLYMLQGSTWLWRTFSLP